MKTLTIIRHAKADKPEAYPSDFDRPLVDRGHKDAERIGAILDKLEPAVDYLISSPAARAAQTANRVAAAIPYAKAIVWKEEVYLATASTLLEIIKETPEAAEHVVLVGHNPGAEEFAAGLCAGNPDSSVLTLPTAALAHITLDIARWSQIRWGAGQLKLLMSPKIIRGG